jgi:hypothetical protein
MLTLQSLNTTMEIWEAICKEFESKPKMLQVDMQCKMHALKCKEGEDVRTHLDTLLDMHEKLAGMVCL